MLSGLFAVVTLCFVRNLFGLVFGLGTAFVFGLLAWKQLRGMHYIIDVLAVMSSLYALYDLSDFLLIGAKTDASSWLRSRRCRHLSGPYCGVASRCW